MFRKVIVIFIVEFFIGTIFLTIITANISSANQDVVDISGVWSGNWYGSGISGTSEYHLTQTGSSITGYEFETYDSRQILLIQYLQVNIPFLQYTFFFLLHIFYPFSLIF